MKNHIKCIMKGCTNHRDEGQFVDSLCKPCHLMITTGEVFNTSTFIGNMRHQLMMSNDK